MLSYFFKNKFIFIYFFWLCWVFVAAGGLSLVAASRGYSSLRCVGFSLRWLLLLRSTGSRRMGFRSCGSRALERRLSSCGARAQLLRGMWDLPGPGLEPVSPALAGRFLTTAPPGKPPVLQLLWRQRRVDGKVKIIQQQDSTSIKYSSRRAAFLMAGTVLLLRLVRSCHVTVGRAEYSLQTLQPSQDYLL